MTVEIVKYNGYIRISIHTLHTEGDGVWTIDDFILPISIHTLHTEGDTRPCPPA